MPGNGASPARTQMAVSGHLRHSSSRCAIAADRLAAAMRARRMSPPSSKTRKRGVLRSCCCGCACAAAAVLAALMLLRLRLRCCGCACSGVHGRERCVRLELLVAGVVAGRHIWRIYVSAPTITHTLQRSHTRTNDHTHAPTITHSAPKITLTLTTAARKQHGHRISPRRALELCRVITRNVVDSTASQPRRRRP